MLFPQSWTGTTTIQFPFVINLIVYIIMWLVAIAGLVFIWRRGKALGFARWTTQDILIVAIMGVLLEVYDNLIGDQFITPIIQLIPFGHALALNDLPYMFLLMVGIALIRKPGAATAMVFLNYILMQLIYSGTGVNVLYWPYGIFQGLFVDLYFVLRGTQVFAKGNATAFWDGLAMGGLRAVPAVTLQSAILGPFLEGETHTLNYILLYSLFNLIGNGLEAAISSPLAIRIARSVNSNTGQIAASSSIALDGGGEVSLVDQGPESPNVLEGNGLTRAEISNSAQPSTIPTEISPGKIESLSDQTGDSHVAQKEG